MTSKKEGERVQGMKRETEKREKKVKIKKKEEDLGVVERGLMGLARLSKHARLAAATLEASAERLLYNVVISLAFSFFHSLFSSP